MKFDFNARHLLPFAAAATMIAMASPASAQSATMSVGATVTDNCTVSTTPVDFGNIDVTTSGPRDTTGGMVVTCTNGTEWSASADAGLAPGATTGTRKMSAANGDLLAYELYTDASRSTIWGDGSDGSAGVGGIGTGGVENQIIYASVLPGQQAVRAGTYTDQINVTISY